MDIINKICGIVVCIIGLGVWGIDYLIFTAIGALTAWIAATVGMTGLAVLGVQIVGWILTLGIMILLLFIGFVIVCLGIGIFLED
ncbi:MAG: hypothetical protein KAS66_05555 [Candidatus Omnitrophica bacterium]|nr:hypothetical protein [Candidatus Omnitrophota bacterium]